MSFIGADQDWEDEIKKLRADLAIEREKTSQWWETRSELDRVSGLLDTERTARESLEKELSEARTANQILTESGVRGHEAVCVLAKERDGLAAVLARVDDVIENWPNGDLDEDAAAMAKVEEIARGSDHATILAAHDARLTAPLERRVGEQAETLRSDAVFLRHYWKNHTVGIQTKDERGYVANSFAAVQIPDWAVRQRLDDIDAALASTPRERQREPEKQV